MENKIKLLKNINTDNSRFILKVIEAQKKNQSILRDKINNSSIVINLNNNFINENIIDLDKIWSTPYFYTNMRLKLNKIIEQFSKMSYTELSKNPKKICGKLVNIKITRNFHKPNDTTDIVDFIQNLDNSKIHTPFTFIAKKIDEETLFKEDQIKKAIKIIKIKDKKEQASYIYDEIYNYLDSDFISNNYCDFINNRCVAQRHHCFYPISKKDGCCFMKIKKCIHLKENGSCNVKCLACRLYSCPYLTKKGINYFARDFVLLKAFFNKKQRNHLVFDFYEDKDIVLNKLLSDE